LFQAAMEPPGSDIALGAAWAEIDEMLALCPAAKPGSA
jgi:hypothetical protein